MRAWLAAFGSALLLSICSISASYAQGWSIITLEEFNRESERAASIPNSRPPSMLALPSSQGDGPAIEVKQPDHNQPINGPVTIIMTFAASAGAKIDLSSMRVLYGWFNFDITDRIKKYATISETGLRAENAELPVGTHSIVFSISDDKGRTTSRKITISVI